MTKTAGNLHKDDFSNYFFVERFTKPVSPLGWSMIGDIIEERAFKQPLRYLGLFGEAKKQIVYLIDGYPFARNETLRKLFQIVPRKLITQDKLNSFMRREDLKDFNVPFFLSHWQFLAFNGIKDPNWLPAYHFFKWKKFRFDNEQMFKEYRRIDLLTKSDNELISLIESLRDQTDRFLALHRWSFVYSEIFYGILKGLIRRWIPSKKLDEDIEIAQKLCTGFRDNVTAQMDRALRSIAHQISQLKNPDDLLNNKERINKFIREFLQDYGYRSESLDLLYPTWAEDSTFLVDMLKAMVPVREGKGYLHIQKAIEMRENTTAFCIDLIKQNNAPIVKQLKVFMFNSLLKITQRFMVLREVQRDQWHKILSQKRRICIAAAQRLIKSNIFEKTEDIFFLKYPEVKQLLSGKRLEQEIQSVIKQRQDEYKRHTEQKIVKTQAATLTGELRGIGVSTGIATGKAIVLHSIDQMKKLRPGDILVTRIIDSSWTPVLNVISGLITEVGGMLSHGAVVAREMGIPAIVGLKDATQLIPEGKEVTMNGKNGIVKK